MEFNRRGALKSGATGPEVAGLSASGDPVSGQDDLFLHLSPERRLQPDLRRRARSRWGNLPAS